MEKKKVSSYTVKLRVKLGLTRAAKTMIATILLALLAAVYEWLVAYQGQFNPMYSVWIGLALSILLGLEKAFQKAK